MIHFHIHDVDDAQADTKGQKLTITLYVEDCDGVKQYNCEFVQNDAKDRDTLICALKKADGSAVSSVKIKCHV